MIRALTIVLVAVSLSGCMAVLGYEPTQAELDAIRRGEDPRAGEEERQKEREQAGLDQQGNAGESGETRASGANPGGDVYEQGPSEGTVLRWLDSTTLVIEADSRRETVALADQQPIEDSAREHLALEQRMDRWTYGTSVKLHYPIQDQSGEVVYRDREGRLLATID